MVLKLVDWQQLPNDAIQLLRFEQLEFFSSWEWYENWIGTVLADHPEQVCFVCYYRDEGITNDNLRLVLPLRRLGTRLYSLSNYYSPLYQVIYAQDSHVEDLSACLKQLQVSTLNWHRLTLQAMQQEAVIDVLKQLKGSGLVGESFFCFGNWYLELKGRDFDTYFSELESRVRHTVTRKIKQFNRLESGRIDLIFGKADLQRGIDDFSRVYALSWKGEETYPTFISGLIRLAAEQGCLRLAVAYLDGQPIAAQLWIVANNTASIFKLAYDENYKKLSVGTVLTATLMRYVIDIDKVQCVDYLSGDDAYKKEWMSHRRERWGIIIFNTSNFQGFLAGYFYKLKRYIKAVFKFKFL